MKIILVTTDFSQAALNAVTYAVDMALLTDAGIVLLYVAPLPLSYSEMPLLVGLEDEMRNMEKQMNALKEEVKQETNGKISVEGEVGMGIFFSELKQVCERIKPYIVVMGSQGKTAAEHLLFGSHAVHAMKTLTWPVITVPSGTNFAVKKVALACDLEELPGTTQIIMIKQFVTDFKATLDIVNTGSSVKFNPDVVFESTVLEEHLKPVKPVYHFIKDEQKTDEAVMNFAGSINIDLLIVLPRYHNLLDRLMHKSHTKELILHSHIPVLAIHM